MPAVAQLGVRPNMLSPPSKAAFGDPADFDVRRAWKSLGGLSLDDAFNKFAQNPFGQVDYFRWIAPAAFIFYFPVVLRYVTGDQSPGDSDTVSSLAGILESQLEQHGPELEPIFSVIAALCSYVIEHYAVFDLQYTIYGDVRVRYEKIMMMVEQGGPANAAPPHR